MKPEREELDALWSRHSAEWREPAQIASQWREAAATEPKLLRYEARGAWWETLERAGITLLVTREYEHLVMALCVNHGAPSITYLPMPHPSGLAVDRARGLVHVASTRNPNQIFELAPITGTSPRLDIDEPPPTDRPLIPVRSRFLPGCLYLHDLALLNGMLLGNAVGENAIVRLDTDGDRERVWWPRCIEVNGAPVFGQNHIQLNSIAAGKTLQSSYFSASADHISKRRPGHRNFPVDKRGVIFSGGTREPVAHGLTRPHSARLLDGRIWVDNSGYGELGFVEDGKLQVASRLPGWTRGLCFHKRIAFVGTSRVIPRFRQYAPGLDVDASVCGLHAVDTKSGNVLGSLIWPYGNQLFAIDWISRKLTSGLPFAADAKNNPLRKKHMFYTFQTKTPKK